MTGLRARAGAAAGASLFVRIFAWFWLAMGLMAAAGMAVTGLVAAARYDALDGVEPAVLVRQAGQALSGGGLAALRRWVVNSEDRYPTLRVVVLGAGPRDILGRRLDTRLDDRFQAHLKLRAFSAGLVAAAPMPPAAAAPAGQPTSWWDLHELRAPDGTGYVLGFLPFDPPHLESLRHSGMPLWLLLLAFAMSAPVCWWLARYISGPVRQLEQGAQALGNGDFGLRLDGALLRRGDELGALARAFGAMADNLAGHVQAREHLLRDVSHELRSPLARMRLALELARRRDASLQAQFDRIDQECSQLDALVGQLLQLARLTDGPSDMPQPLELADIIGAVVADARFEAAGAARHVAWQAGTAPLPVLGVPRLLRSALDNVLRNALRHTPPGSTVRVAAWADGAAVLVEISDQGSGVAEADLALLFEPFFRAGLALAPAAGSVDGAGLGLAIAAAVVQQHGGQIGARNGAPPGARGLVVAITLPALLP